MSLTMFATALVLLAVMLVPLGVGAVRLRARLVPAWSGAPARLAEVVVLVASLLAVLHVLGAVGLYRRGFLAAGGALAGLAITVLAGRLTPPAAAAGLLGDDGDAVADREARGEAYPVWSLAAAGVAVAAVAAQWTAWVTVALRRGITDYDSLTYHLPQAARFAQTGWVTRLHFANPEFPNMFHPGESELLHGLGMAMFQRDVASPVANLGWLAVVLLAAWCLGRPFRAAPLAVVAVAAVLATPLMALQPGSALTDLASAGMLVVVLALLVQPDGGRGALALAAAAGGVAIGLKLTMLAPIGVLTLALAVLAWRRRQWGAWLWWAVPLVVTGSFWYLRNLFRGASPVPSLHLGPGPIPFAEPSFQKLDDFGYSVLHYLFDVDVWKDYFLPGLADGLGRAWPVLALATVAGLVLVLVGGGDRRRLAAVTGIAAVVAYAVTPASAFGPEGQPGLFVHNLRYLFPGLLAGVALLATARGLRRPVPAMLFLAGAAIVAGAGMVAEEGALRGWPDQYRRVGASAGLAVLAAAAVLIAVRARRPQLEEAVRGARARPALTAAVGVAVAALVAGGAFVVQDDYLDRRYLGNQQIAWVDSVSPARIGFVGIDVGYLLYGIELGNRVQYVGERGPNGEFHQIDDCATWRRALRDGDYDFVAHWHNAVYPDHVWEEWTVTDAGAREVYRAADIVVYSFHDPPDPATCPVP